MSKRILITGSSGLVGSALTLDLEEKGFEIRPFDLRAQGAAHGDILDFPRLSSAMEGIDGIIHLAAVSRVIWGEVDPGKCWKTNVHGIRHILESASSSREKPWVIFASSREVYGQPEKNPVDEDCPLRPVNVYGYAKIEGERLVEAARRDGVRACTVRLSNVYGSTADHHDRVVPAFAQTAARGGELRVDGPGHVFDFTYISDVSRGIVSLVELLLRGEAPPPPIHFVGGEPTTLGELAELAISLGKPGASMRVAPSRDFDVARFWGTYDRAKKILGWEPKVGIREGLGRLIRQYEEERSP